MTCRIGAAALLGSWTLAAGVAEADHDMAMSEPHDDSSSLSVGVAVQAAEFETMSYVGSYQSVTPSLGWMRGRFGASAMLGLYHLEENGLSTYGLGDVMFGGHAAVIERDALQAGVAVHVMLPTGSELDNLGMGHTMAMPSLWAAWHGEQVAAMASAGYARALTSLEAGHDHGPSPLVDPMNLQELTWSAGADLEVGHHVRLGGHALGGVPIGTGHTRVIGGGRVSWGTPRVSTAFELQAGIAGDPFTVRGVVETALRF
ncbi:MAG: hypothetical protein ABIY55_09960 [Kofleriaceae bacterium]